MSNRGPDFFLSSSETRTFKGPHRCWVEANIRGKVRNDYLLVRIEPPAIHFVSKNPINLVILAGRIEPLNLRTNPHNVYISVPKGDVVSSEQCDENNIETVGSGDIFPTFKEAEDFAKSCDY